jgi:cell division protein FtsB
MNNMTRSQQILLLSLTFFIVMMMVAIFHEDGILTVLDLEQNLVELKDGNKALKNENDEMRDEIKSLKSDPVAIEKIAREKLRMVKPGETVYQIVREQKSQAPGH